MGLAESYRLRLIRKRLRLRALRKSRELHPVQNRTKSITPGAQLLFCTLRDELVRLPYFYEYYRNLGVDHFLMVDNGSQDGTREFLADQPDTSVWHAKGLYRKARFGVDWLNFLQRKYAHGHWSLVVDPDEFLVFPYCDSRPLSALTDWLDTNEIRSFSAMLLDMYPKGALEKFQYKSGQNPFEVAKWFDSGNYTIEKNPLYGNLWIQGGPRARVYFADAPKQAPALNKVPLVKWNKSYVYVSSTHLILPRGLNRVYESAGGEKPSGMLLHAKFLNTLSDKANEELRRNQHYAHGREYQRYNKKLNSKEHLWCSWSEEYINWRQLEVLGLMSKGSWA